MATFIPAVDDSWAVLAQPPGLRDLGLRDHWARSLERSRRRREARRGRVAELGAARAGGVLAAVAVTGAATAAGITAEPAAAVTQQVNLHRGSRGPQVAALQRRLGIPADGVLGRQTRRAVKRYQRHHGLSPDGVVGPATAGALGLETTAKSRTRKRTQRSAASRPQSVRLTPTATKALQSALGVGADGALGPVTRRALKRYERAHGMRADGRPDTAVLGALGVDPDAAPEPAKVSAPEPSGSGSSVVAAARRAIGVPYASAGTTRRGFDCSGLTVWAFKKAGVSLPRTSYDQFGVGSPVSGRQIRAGDLVFFNTAGGGASHVGVATSAATVISATAHGVMEHSIGGGYWGSHYVGARRVR